MSKHGKTWHSHGLRMRYLGLQVERYITRQLILVPRYLILLTRYLILVTHCCNNNNDNNIYLLLESNNITLFRY